MANEQFLRYKKQFKLDCILKATSSGMALLAIIFFLFLPIFKISDPFFGIELYSFSLFDETKNAFSSISDGFHSPAAVLNVYQILVLVFMVLGTALSIFSLVKNILNIVDPDKYVLEQYNNLKKGGGKKSFYGRFSAPNCFISAVIMEILYIVMSKVFSDMGMGTAIVSNFSLVNGVTGYISLFIIFALGVIGITVYDKILMRKVKYEILKEDYGISQTPEQSA